jgi:hypothetical protein
MTRDEIRFEELTRRPHLWPEEVTELERLGETLGKEIRLVTVKIEDLVEKQHASTA